MGKAELRFDTLYCRHQSWNVFPRGLRLAENIVIIAGQRNNCTYHEVIRQGAERSQMDQWDFVGLFQN